MKSIPAEIMNPKQRILKTARILFYEQGYSTTGINQIISDSKTSKKSFYHYYESKDNLAEAYLLLQKEDLLKLLTNLTIRCENYKSFVRMWVTIIKKGINSGIYQGCPFAKFAGQIPGNSMFNSILKTIVQEWKSLLFNFINAQAQKYTENISKDKIENVVDQILLLYQGAVQMWSLSDDMKYINDLEQELLKLDFQE